jgi:hypothetical protein
MGYFINYLEPAIYVMDLLMLLKIMKTIIFINIYQVMSYNRI